MPSPEANADACFVLDASAIIELKNPEHVPWTGSGTCSAASKRRLSSVASRSRKWCSPNLRG